MRKLEDLSTEELQEECDRREIQLEISDGDEESFFYFFKINIFNNLLVLFLYKFEKLEKIARDHLTEWMKENEHDPETYDFDAEEEYDEGAEGGEEDEEDLLDAVAAEAAANANEEKEGEKKDETEDKSEVADTNEDVAEKAAEEVSEATEKPDEENGEGDDREVEEEKTEEPKEDFEMVEQAEVDAANEAESEVQDQAPSEQANGTTEEAEEQPAEEKMDTTEGEGAAEVAADEEFSDDSSDMFKEAQKAKLNEENNQSLAPEAVPEADILELDYDDDTLIDKPAESVKEKQKETPEGKSTEVDKMANVKFLWISGLNKDVKATEIREEFEKNELGDRPLRSCKVAVSKKNGGSAFAFCEMGTAELADKIIALYHAKDMCGKIVQIKKERFYSKHKVPF